MCSCLHPWTAAAAAEAAMRGSRNNKISLCDKNYLAFGIWHIKVFGITQSTDTYL